MDPQVKLNLKIEMAILLRLLKYLLHMLLLQYVLLTPVICVLKAHLNHFDRIELP